MTDKKKDRPFVFVRCLTYNHEKYIEDALNGFAMQKTDFPFVVTIVNDASPDKTAEVIKNFILKNCNSEDISYEQTSYADIIMARPIANTNCLLYVLNLFENHFRKKTHRPYYKQFTDKANYWAECEGDDYWIDPYKLQKQVDYMEEHPDCTCYAHNSLLLKTATQQIALFNKELFHAKDYELSEFLNKTWFTPTQSLLYRKEAYKSFDDIPVFMHGDYSLLLNILLKDGSYLHYENEIMSVYRDGGWASTNFKELDLFDDYVALLEYYKEKSNHRCDDVFDAQIELQKKGKEQYIQQMQEAKNNKKLINRIKHKLTRIFKAIC